MRPQNSWNGLGLSRRKGPGRDQKVTQLYYTDDGKNHPVSLGKEQLTLTLQ